MSYMKQNMKRNCHKYLDLPLLRRLHGLKAMALLLTAGFALGACQAEDFGNVEERPEGLPAEVSLRLSLPAMELQTRALTDDQASAVNNIWVGIYDAGHGGRLKGWHYQEVSHGDRHVLHQLTGIKASSGNAYIVAVANAGDNYGMSSLGEAQDGTRTNLLELLREADTFEKYKAIAVALHSPSIVEYTDANVVMTGVWSSDPSGTHPGGPGIEPVYIKGGNSVLDGRIHLRRVISQVTFNIRSGAAGLVFRPTSWRVVNNPRMSFLYERADGDADGLTNASDEIIGHLDDSSPNANYGASTPETEVQGSSGGGYSFSFYTYENKRTGNAADYDSREKEHKDADGKNSGIYVALCGDSMQAPDLKNGVNRNNFATFVELTCEVSYLVGGVQRTGTARYTVHLGYMNGDASDFNVRRNHKYIYDMTILGLNQIVLEARSEGNAGEVHPGLEGNVIDATEEIVTVDAHYGAYNISLSNSERARLHYLIEAPYGDGPAYVIEGGYVSKDSGKLPAPDRDNEYYNWIRIKPTARQDILAEYKTSAADEPWYMDDLVGVDAAHRGYGDDTGNLDDDTQRWYTVFINENVYEGDAHPLSDWVNYVNKDMRTVLFLVEDIAVSPDTESRYSQGKYLIRQRSIQTYYSTDLANYGTSEPTALGVEHINESYGKNIDWRWVAPARNSNGAPTNTTDLSNSNGRWNLWKFLNNATNANSNSGLGNAEATRNWWCGNALSSDNGRNGAYGLVRYVNTQGSNQNTRTGYMKADEEGYAVPALAYYTDPSSTAREQDPHAGSNRYYEASALCMSRNRDLDGDGRISPDEVRWYLPAEGKYERIMLGRNSLATPIFSVSNGLYYTNPNDEVAVENNNWGYDGSIGSGNDNQVQFISSDHMKFFPEEGGSYNRNVYVHWAGGSGRRYPWNIRCVRNLGVNLATVTQDPDDDPVEKAYFYDASRRVFDMTHYYGNSLRAAIDTYIEVHTLLELDKNKTPKKLKVSRTSSSYVLGERVNGNQRYNTVDAALNANVPCADYHEDDDGGATWRAPNQRELMMMLNEKLIGGELTFSCTKEGYGSGGRFACSEVHGTMYMNSNAVPAVGGTLRVRCVRDLE